MAVDLSPHMSPGGGFEDNSYAAQVFFLLEAERAAELSGWMHADDVDAE